MRRALAINEASFGKGHSELVMPLYNLAQLLKSTGRLPEAEPFQRRALEIVAATMAATGLEQPNWKKLAGNYGKLLEELGNTREQALEKVRKILEPGSNGPHQ